MDGEWQPLEGTTDRFTVTQYGHVSFECHVLDASQTWTKPVIVVCSIVGFILLCIIPAVLCCRRRRKKSKNAKGSLKF